MLFVMPVKWGGWGLVRKGFLKVVVPEQRPDDRPEVIKLEKKRWMCRNRDQLEVRVHLG